MSDGLTNILSEHRQHVNPGWADLVEAIGLPTSGLRGEGCWLYTTEGLGMLDMVACFGAAVLGHNPPALLNALHLALDKHSPMTAPLAIVREAGQLASKLLSLAGHGLEKVHFASSGAEAVDTALKLAAARTGRRRFLGFKGGFHGLTVGATSVAGDVSWRTPFPDIWLSSELVRRDDLESLEDHLRRRDVAAVLLEPVPGSDASDGWSPDTLCQAAALCRQYGSLLVMDEVLTGLGRTGDWFAFHRAGPAFRPDIVLVSKALTGGIVPVSAALMTDAVFAATFETAERAKIHGSTLAGNRLAMECGLAVIDLIEKSHLVSRAADAGQRLRKGLVEGLGESGPECVLGRGLLLSYQCGRTIEEARARGLELIRRGLLVTLMPHAQTYARLTPALTISDEEIDTFLDGAF